MSTARPTYPPGTVLPLARHDAGGLARAVAWLQGLYYLATGLWPILSIETFQQVTGRKTDHLVTGREADHWLVMTVAALVLAVGLSLVVAAWRRDAPAAATLGMSCAVALTAIDVIYVAREVIAPIYLADAAAEVVLFLGWCAGMARLRRA